MPSYLRTDADLEAMSACPAHKIAQQVIIAKSQSLIVVCAKYPPHGRSTMSDTKSANHSAHRTLSLTILTGLPLAEQAHPSHGRHARKRCWPQPSGIGSHDSNHHTQARWRTCGRRQTCQTESPTISAHRHGCARFLCPFPTLSSPHTQLLFPVKAM